MSLNLRIILSATLVLAAFISITAFALEHAFVKSSNSALRDKLTSQLYALMATAEVTNNGVLMPSDELDALLGLPSSGVYAYICNKKSQVLWQSSSVLGAKPPPPIALSSGVKSFNQTTVNHRQYYQLAYGVNWSTSNHSAALTFNIITDLKSFNKQISQYRTTLWGWLIAMAILLLISQMLILRWGLLPLRQVAAELNQVDAGKQNKIEKKYPLEIERLTSIINRLLLHEKNQKKYYRNALGNLAHSLKTPLAVIQSSISKTKKQAQSDLLQQQVNRMNSIVEYQCQKAATAGANASKQSINILACVNRITQSLNKVYADKQIKIKTTIDKKIIFKGDEGDLMELLGNLLDNAYKWANQQIDISASTKNNKLFLCIMDDGKGIEEKQIKNLLQRGVRADESLAGHGIGLSIVSNIVNAYQGSLSIKKSSLGGAQFCIEI